MQKGDMHSLSGRTTSAQDGEQMNLIEHTNTKNIRQDEQHIKTILMLSSYSDGLTCTSLSKHIS